MGCQEVMKFRGGICNDMLNGSMGMTIYLEEMAVTLLMVDQVMMNSAPMMW